MLMETDAIPRILLNKMSTLQPRNGILTCIEEPKFNELFYTFCKLNHNCTF